MPNTRFEKMNDLVHISYFAKSVFHIFNICFLLLQMNTIWVSCDGENPADQENIGPVDYLPIRGFPGYFYPYQNSVGYLSPLVAVQFQRPKRK